MANRVGPRFTRDLNLAFRDQRPCNRGAEQVKPLIDCIGPKHRENIVANEVFSEILNINLLDPEQFRFFARGLQLLPLSEIGREGHNLASISHLQPFQNDGRIEAA